MILDKMLIDFDFFQYWSIVEYPRRRRALAMEQICIERKSMTVTLVCFFRDGDHADMELDEQERGFEDATACFLPLMRAIVLFTRSASIRVPSYDESTAILPSALIHYHHHV